jgi:Xaa-Pro aminopeptidase
MRRLPWAAAALLPASLAGAGELSDDLRARRARLMEALGVDSIFVHWSAPEQVYSRDVDYEYRQDSDMLYQTGVDQPGTTLVLMPGDRSKQSFLFVSDLDVRREHWSGHLLAGRD